MAGLKGTVFSTSDFFSISSFQLIYSLNFLQLSHLQLIPMDLTRTSYFDHVWLLYRFVVQLTTIKMMRVIIPNFKKFDNVAICPSDSGMDIFCVVTGGSGLYIDFSSISTGGVTCSLFKSLELDS